MRAKFIAAIAVFPALAGCFGPNGSERLADRVTTAIVANDMRPVEKEFNAIVRPKLENRQMVGKVSSDQLSALGRFKGVRETTPRGTSDGKHTFEADFQKAKWVEDMVIDTDGKIAAFHIHQAGQGISPASRGVTVMLIVLAAVRTLIGLFFVAEGVAGFVSHEAFYGYVRALAGAVPGVTAFPFSPRSRACADCC